MSRFSIRKALAKLEAIGVVKPKTGSGYFVNTAIIGTPLIYNSITENSFEHISYKKVQLNKRVPTIMRYKYSLSEKMIIYGISNA
ncbi:transcriptional regulator GntR family [Vibrio maritimus]|uniref:Transcriptional regulator GntR family n=1 Tax=Vibrio maritimus TaxID=990268 RepID=A0A090T2A1_9VIBR|nr:transcriptional regulator GntR family [Vibrio maritimus]